MSAHNGKINIRVQAFVLVVSMLLLGIKFIAWWLTGSNAILTDAVESVVNVLAASFTLYALWISAQDKDEDHPYGHGKIEFISAGAEGTLILIAGLFLIVKSTYNLYNPHEFDANEVGILLIAVAGIVNLVLGLYQSKRGKKVNSLALEASGQHLLSDAITSIGLLCGLIVLYFFPIYWLDNSLAILFGGIISVSGIRIVQKSVAGIMDKADVEFVAKLATHLQKNRKNQWIDIHNLRVVKYGANIHIDAHLSLPFYYTVEQMHYEVESLNKCVNTMHKSNVEMFVHVDPCLPMDCSLCSLANCNERKSIFQQNVEWDTSRLMKNKKHSKKE
jgi:cation diffusion facilitator family transporter